MASKQTVERADKIVTRLWGDVPVVDAEKELRVFIVPEDIESATIKDPACCVFAQACKRTFGATKVLFYRTFAYVELPLENGQIRVERFVLPKAMRDLIAAFDTGETVIPKAGFLMKPPTFSTSLEGKAGRAKHHQEWLAKRNRRALLGETIADRGGGNRATTVPIESHLTVRSGTGSVHFTMTKKQKRKAAKK